MVLPHSVVVRAGCQFCVYVLKLGCRWLCHGTCYHTPNQPETTHICEVTVAAGQESRQGLGVSTESQNGRPWC